MRPGWRLTVAAAGAASLALAMTAPALGAPGGEERDAAKAPLVGSRQARTAAGGQSHTVTLITGDRVRLTTTPSGNPSVLVLPGKDGTVPVVETRQVGKKMFVYPASAAKDLAAGRLDERLFDVTGLVAQGYDDASTDTIPVIVQYTTSVTARMAPATPRGATKRATLPSIDAVAMKAPKADTASVWADVSNRRSAAGASVAKIWLDGQVKASLAESTKQIGAAAAWAAGLDGTGATVAVLDSGVDPDHPDLVGQIAQSQDFTDNTDGSTYDGNGHGTHTASTVAGTGAASKGRAERGVAPGARLLIGKVLSDWGSGTDSQIIAGMQWAVDQGADVVSMSLGSSEPTTTCDDPMAQAVEYLSAGSDSLFVIAAGNMGSGLNTIATPACASAALTVGAVDSQDKTAWFSSRGPVGGTHTLKPEIAAPGVDVLAAAAGGRGVYAYQTMSGTSMATPMVAGAAAILKQQHPGWTGATLKSALVAAAKSDVPGDVREVGAGRLDVARAITQTVTSAPSLQGGAFGWPQVASDVSTVQIPYTNRGTSPVTLRLAVADVTGNDGSAVASKVATLGSSRVTVAAGKTVTVPLRVNGKAALTKAQYGDVTGRVLATGDAEVSTPFSLYVEPQTVTVRVKLVDRAGAPASGSTSVDLINTDTSIGERRYNSGSTDQSFRVRPGSYFLSAFVTTPLPGGDEWAPTDSATLLARPRLTVTRDVAVVLDARTAHRISTHTDRPSEARSGSLTFARIWPSGGATDTSWVDAGTLIVGTSAAANMYADVRGRVPAAEGSFEMGTYTRRMAPLISSMSVLGGPALSPFPASYGHTNLDGRGSAKVVDAGAGSAEELAAAEVSGKVALVTMPDADTYVGDVAQAAHDAGAMAVLVHHTGSAPWFPGAGFLGIALPTYAIPAAQAADLRERLATQEVTLEWKATAVSPFAYNLGFTERTVTAPKAYQVRDRNLGRTEATYHAMGVATDYTELLSAVRPSGLSYPIGAFDALPAPSTRTELYTDDGTSWQQYVQSSMPFGEAMSGDLQRYTAGSSRTESWYDGTVSPTVRLNSDGSQQLVAERQGNLLGVAPAIWGDSFGHWSDGGSFGDIGNLSLQLNGEEIGASYWPGGVFEVPAAEGRYTLVLNTEKFGMPAAVWLRSSRVVTAWTFTSKERPKVYSQPLPLMFPRVDLPEDELKTLPAKAGVELPVRVLGHAGYDPGVLRSATVSLSFDDGLTWTKAATSVDGTAALATVDLSAHAGAQVTLKVVVVDAKGAKVEQTITRAFDVR